LSSLELKAAYPSPFLLQGEDDYEQLQEIVRGRVLVMVSDGFELRGNGLGRSVIEDTLHCSVVSVAVLKNAGRS
jgi:hypothetical protein